jgi:hypothetical protein
MQQDCPICGRQHTHTPATCKEVTEQGVQRDLAKTLEQILDKYGDTNAVRLMIANFAVGYTGAAFGLHIPS